VTSVAFSPDGKAIVSTSVDKTVLIWRFAADEGTAAGAGHTREVTALGVDADGKLLVSGSRDRTVRLWDTATGAEVRLIGGHATPVVSAVIMPDGKTVLSYSEDRKLRAWDAVTGKELRSVDCPDEVLLLSVPAGGKSVLAWTRRHGAGDDDQIHTVQVVDPKSLKPVETLSERGRQVTCLAFSGNGDRVAMGSPDGSVRIWNVAKKERVGSDRPATSKSLLDLALTPDDKTLVTGGRDGEIKVWPLDKQEPARTFRTAAGDLGGLVVAPDSVRLGTYSSDGIVEVWDLTTGKSLRRWDLDVGVRTLLFLPGGKQVATANDNGTIYLLQLP
jgi:WD40 repeat protein